MSKYCTLSVCFIESITETPNGRIHMTGSRIYVGPLQSITETPNGRVHMTGSRIYVGPLQSELGDSRLPEYEAVSTGKYLLTPWWSL